MLTVPKGYLFSTAEANFRYTNRDDLAIILSTEAANIGAVFTTNKFSAAPIKVARDLLKKSNYKANAILINSGIANAGTGALGIENCIKSLDIVGCELNIAPKSIIPASTGVIGQHFNMDAWERGAKILKENMGKKDITHVAKAIMTTDTFPKISLKSEGDINILGIAKGSGMICPNMATMLSFLITDVEIEHNILQKILKEVVELTFNRISVDGDTSTNDCVIVMANGLSGIRISGEEFTEKFKRLMYEVCYDLAYKIVQDAEGGTKIIHLTVKNAKTVDDARKAARAIAHSLLVKTALYGEDANWGRIIAALGRSEADFQLDKVTLKIGDVVIFRYGLPVDMDIDSLAACHLKKQDIIIEVDLGEHNISEYSMMFSDLSEEYVKINGSYRS